MPTWRHSSEYSANVPPARRPAPHGPARPSAAQCVRVDVGLGLNENLGADIPAFGAMLRGRQTNPTSVSAGQQPGVGVASRTLPVAVRRCRALADPATQAWCTRNAGRTLAVVVQADDEAAVPGSHPAASAHSLPRAQPPSARRPGRGVYMHQRPCHTSSAKQLGPRGRAGRSLDHDYEREAPCAGRQAHERQLRLAVAQRGAYFSGSGGIH